MAGENRFFHTFGRRAAGAAPIPKTVVQLAPRQWVVGVALQRRDRTAPNIIGEQGHEVQGATSNSALKSL
jgi:hypothetical protein